MNFYPENYDVSLPINFIDGAGEAAAPSDATALLLDDDGQQIADLGAVSFAPGETTGAVIVPGAHHVIPEGERFSIRVLKIVMTYPAGEVTLNISYAIEREVALEVMNNTFMSYERAILVSMDVVSKAGWAASDEGLRKSALIEAFRRLTGIPMKIYPRDAEGVPDYRNPQRISREIWQEMDKSAFDALPTYFKRVLQRAQFVQANDLLQGSKIANKRKSGIVSETIGESSVKLSTTILESTLCGDALDALSGYLDFTLKIERA